MDRIAGKGYETNFDTNSKWVSWFWKQVLSISELNMFREKYISNYLVVEIGSCLILAKVIDR
jgi:hypothetical protein